MTQIDPQEYQKSLDRLSGILAGIATHADEQATFRCPYMEDIWYELSEEEQQDCTAKERSLSFAIMTSTSAPPTSAAATSASRKNRTGCSSAAATTNSITKTAPDMAIKFGIAYGLQGHETREYRALAERALRLFESPEQVAF